MSTHGTALRTFFEKRASQRLSSFIFLLSACFFFRFLFLRALFLFLFLRSAFLRSSFFLCLLLTLPCVRTKTTSWLSSGNVNRIRTTKDSMRRSVDVLMASGRWLTRLTSTVHTDYAKQLSFYLKALLFNL